MPLTRKLKVVAGIFTMPAGMPLGGLVGAMGTSCCGRVVHTLERLLRGWALN